MAMPTERCPECLCLWDDHRTELEFFESDDPADLHKSRSNNYGGDFITCTNCTDCYTERPTS